MKRTTIGRYLIQEIIQRGSMSTVYLALDPLFEREVAVKVLPAALLDREDYRLRFRREAKIAATLEHPAIVPVYDFGEDEGEPFIVFRYMAGGSLAERIQAGRFSVTEAATILLRLAEGLDEAHARGIIHRDLKPNNILFDQRGDAFVSDFGIAKLAEAEIKLTGTGDAVGTLAYMSPEQLRGGVPLDGRSDVYALGVILYEMLTGQHPYDTDTPMGMAVKHLMSPVPNILAHMPELPGTVQGVISRALAKEPADRFATAAELATAVANLDSAPDHPKPAPTRKRALIITNELYDHAGLSGPAGAAVLTQTSTTAAALAHALRDPDRGAFDDVRQLTDPAADQARRAAAAFFADAVATDLLLLYFTGRALHDESGHFYLALRDTDPDLPRATALSAGFLADTLNDSPAQQQVIIMETSHRNSQQNKTNNHSQNIGATLASSAHTRLIVDADADAAPPTFTRLLADGLGDGAADRNSTGEITLAELVAYAQAQLPAPGNGAAPRQWSFNRPEQIVIAHAPRPATPLPIRPMMPANGSNGHQPGAAPPPAATPPAPRHHETAPGAPTRRRRLWAGGALLLLLLFTIPLFIRIVGLNSPRPAPPANALVAAAEATVTPTATTRPLTHTAVPPSATPIATRTQAAMATPTATIPVRRPATAINNAAFYAGPGLEYGEICHYAAVNEQITVLARSANDSWLLAESETGVTGWVATRFFALADLAQLPVNADFQAPIPGDCRLATPTPRATAAGGTAFWNTVVTTEVTGSGIWRVMVPVRVPRGGSYTFSAGDRPVSWSLSHSEGSADYYVVTIGDIACNQPLVTGLTVARDGQPLTVRNEHSGAAGDLFIPAPNCA